MVSKIELHEIVVQFRPHETYEALEAYVDWLSPEQVKQIKEQEFNTCTIIRKLVEGETRIILTPVRENNP